MSDLQPEQFRTVLEGHHRLASAWLAGQDVPVMEHTEEGTRHYRIPANDIYDDSRWIKNDAMWDAWGHSNDTTDNPRTPGPNTSQEWWMTYTGPHKAREAASEGLLASVADEGVRDPIEVVLHPPGDPAYPTAYYSR